MQVFTAHSFSHSLGQGPGLPLCPEGQCCQVSVGEAACSPLLPFGAPSRGGLEPMVGPGAAQRCPPGWALVLRRAQSCLLAARSWCTASSWLSSHWASARTDWLCRTAGRGWGHTGGGQPGPPTVPRLPTLPSATYHSGRWPAWPGPGSTVPGAPAGPAAGGGQGRGRGRGWRGARHAGWAGAAGARRTRAEAGAGAGCWREPGRCLQAGERRGQNLATGTAGASTAPPAVLSPSVPLCPPEAQCRSLMDSTGRRLMAPDSLLSGSPGSAGAAPSALPMLSAGAEEKGQPVPCLQPPPAPGNPVGPEPCRGDPALAARCCTRAGSQGWCSLGTALQPQWASTGCAPLAPPLSSEQLAGAWWPRSRSLVSGAGIWPWLGGRNVPPPSQDSPGTVGLAGAPRASWKLVGRCRAVPVCGVAWLTPQVLCCLRVHRWRCGVYAVPRGPGAHCPSGHVTWD